jgi:hypothetical protein
LDGGEPLWLSSKVVKNEKINDIKRTRVRSPPRATSFKKNILDGALNEMRWYILWPFGIFYGHLEYFQALWNIFRPFGILYGDLVIFGHCVYVFSLRFGILYQENSGNPAFEGSRTGSLSGSPLYNLILRGEA